MNAPELQSGKDELSVLLDQLIESANRIILGKEHSIRLALSCLLARGHLLIEDQPGVGKTTLAKALACLMGLELKRIQFTSDLLPADIIGASIYNRDTESFRFQPGPIFSRMILADEVNRATPRAQSALLEAMEEQQVTIEGETRALPSPFLLLRHKTHPHRSELSLCRNPSWIDLVCVLISVFQTPQQNGNY